MASGSSESTFNLRHRLVGAFILIALAVFVLPMVLRGATHDEKTVTVDIPTPSEKRKPREFTSRVTAVGTAAEKVVEQVGSDGTREISFGESAPNPEVAAQVKAPELPKVVVTPPAPAPTEDDVVVIASTAPAVTAPAPEVAPEVKVAPAPAPKPKPTPKPEPKPKVKTGNVPDSSLNVTTDRGWIVRVGTFGQPSNARTMSRLLKSKGFAPRATREKTKEGLTMTRVWVGPFPERVTAGRVLENILDQTGEKGFIAPYP